MSNWETKFWQHVDRRGDDECWPWLLSCAGTGYGQIWQGKTMRGTHRVAYELTFGSIPDGFYVCHRCDNRPCCNPAHLWAGPPRENVVDMYRKGRARSRPVQGESHPGHKLLDADVIEIRQRWAEGGVKQRDLAADYAVSQRLIFNIIHGLAWPHLEAA